MAGKGTGTPRFLPALAALNAMLALTFGTFAVHGLAPGREREWILIGAMFQLPHAAAVFALLGWRRDRAAAIGAWALALGSLVFAGILDLLAMGAPRGLAALAPIGGSLMMLGWLWIAIVALAGDRLALFARGHARRSAPTPGETPG
ncbi:MAG: DUF423 domain-containing protein [Sphingomonadaceae bacterium]|uniref:DUF423 domain-containing protein n=1 Tax=Thermaurantiacus sp. TaxID=2820283 RepID=UPI00298EF2E5|nr:DUF423 domain-containing protein [Thermaurantiacus sp.]MCS6986493.1 DUF423 domain-containing protein [Sphingomonadaceae bacterium]MDW8414246.1 DUF423 domain-containing protein [Thermaurantiacus sp.]